MTDEQARVKLEQIAADIRVVKRLLLPQRKSSLRIQAR